MTGDFGPSWDEVPEERDMSGGTEEVLEAMGFDPEKQLWSHDSGGIETEDEGTTLEDFDRSSGRTNYREQMMDYRESW